MSDSNNNSKELMELRVSLKRCLSEAEGWLDEARGCEPENVSGYDGWAHEARRLLSGDKIITKIIKFKPLTIQIPKPKKDGACNECCPLIKQDEWQYYCAEGLEAITSDLIIVPSFGCPWYKGK